MKIQLFAPLLASALLAATAADAATTIFSQNFSGGLGANESVSGNFKVANGQMGHENHYSNNEYSYYQISLDLTGYTSALLEFDFSIDSEINYDGFNVLASTDTVFTSATELLAPQNAGFYGTMGNNFARLGKYAVSGKYAGKPTFDLSQFAGQTVNLRFQFQSDQFAFKPGVRMDNLKITGNAIGAVPEPATWALMIGGFGMAGATLRRSRQTALRIRA
ncbi:MAG: PEPxxWA-CTERM sorting domain-containing protein [Pseudomonadota bacterium]